MNKNVIAAGVSLLISLAYIVFAFQISSSTFESADVGPQVFPIVIGVLWVVMSLILLVKGWLEARKTETDQLVGEEAEIAKSNEESMDSKKQDPVKVVVILLLFIVYILLFSVLGYVLSTGLFIAGVTMYLERKKWLRNCVYAVVFPIIVYFVFNNLLSVHLPTGLFS